MLRCADGTLYTGYTTNLVAREAEHNGEGQTVSDKKRGAKYTRGRRPVLLVYSEAYATRSEALKREIVIKKLTKAQKEAQIASAPFIHSDA
jgi:putative endonuclease